MFWDNFVFYCTKAGTSPNAVAKELGFSSGSVTAWKNGTVPRSSAVVKIANYFDINIEDLIQQKEKAAPISGSDFSERDIQFLEIFRRLSVEEQDLFLKMFRAKQE